MRLGRKISDVARAALIGASALFAAALPSCSTLPAGKSAERLRIDVQGGPMLVAHAGETRTATATLLPANSSDKNIVWVSSDTSKVTCGSITVSGAANTLTLVADFTTTVTVTASAEADSTVTGSFSVTCQHSASVTQLYADGSFTNTTDHGTTNCTTSVSSNVITMAPNGATSAYSMRVTPISPNPITHKFYMAMTVSPSALTDFNVYQAGFIVFDSSGTWLVNYASQYWGSSYFAAGAASRISGVFDLSGLAASYPTAHTIQPFIALLCLSYPTSIATKCSWADLVDLTASFGSGNEPTASWMDSAMQATFPSKWFSGTQTMAW